MSAAIERAYCNGCGEPLARIHGTAYVACCSPRYWLSLFPLPRDRAWWPVRTCTVGVQQFALYEPQP